MTGTEKVHFMPGFVEDFTNGLRNFRARHLLLIQKNTLGASLEFLKTANLIERYRPGEKKYWMKLADSFLSYYKLQKDDVREQIRQKLYPLSTYQQSVLVETLWEYSPDTDRNWWLSDLITKLWQSNKTDKKREREFGFFLRHATIIPRDVREGILAQ